MTMTPQESFGQAIDKLLAQAIQEHKTFSMQISIKPAAKPEIIIASEKTVRKTQRPAENEIDEIFMIGHPAQL